MTSSLQLSVVTAIDGATLLMLNGYAFIDPSPMPNGERWYCSGRYRWKCNVCLHVNDDYELVCISHEHTHKPPVYEKTASASCKIEIDDIASEADFIEANLEGIEDSSVCESENIDDRNIAIIVESIRGKPSLLVNGHKYRKVYKTKHGTRWNCSRNKNCSAFLYLNDKDEVIMCNEIHDHAEPEKMVRETDNNDASAVVITSRKGKEMLLFHNYTYRRQYTRSDKVRWVCSTTKNCRACVFTNMDNFIISSYEEHCHDPPKYYLKPDHVLEALREPIILETDE